VSPLLIVAIPGLGWVLVSALKPVQRMTDEADTFSLGKGDRRLRQPPGDDEIAHIGRTAQRHTGR